MAYTASAPVNARFSAFSSVTFAAKASAPRLVNVASLLLSRPTTRTFFFLPSSAFATTEPVFPVAPRITYITSSLLGLAGCWLGCREWFRSYRLNHGNFYAGLFCKLNRFRVSGIHVSRHAQPGIIRQHALDALRHFFRSIRHRHLSRMLRISNPHAAPVMNGHPRRAA